MQPFQNMKVVASIPPGVIKDNAAYVSKVIDTAVAGAAQALVFTGILGATDIAMAALKVVESDDAPTDANTLSGSPTDVLDVATKPSATDDNGVWIIEIDLKKPHKRYMQLQATAGNGTAGTYFAAVGFLTNVGVPPANSGATVYAKG